jgi:hypothetical protein
MIDAIDSLAFSMFANKGVYALMLGSGISRAAQIPTGWEITLELVRKVAVLEGAEYGADPAAWYLATKGRAPDYSELLDALTNTPAERQQLLRPYWEPTEQEREDGAKLPTKAHRAIADLIKSGYVRVIITTNFDRLLETALHDVGIQPTVLSTPDHIDGALPLIHTPCTIVKIHGDYLDTRIRNTSEELAVYPEHFNKLLDRIFDEFGLIISGWSADWDDALRSAMTRAPYRRFSTYWASRGEPSVKAADLIARKGATLVNISDADSYFHALNEKINALETFSRPHPISVDATVASLKKYLSEPKFRIAHYDLVHREIDALRDTIAGPTFDVNQTEITGQTVESRLHAYETSAETLIKMAFVAGQWAEAEQVSVWADALLKLIPQKLPSGRVFWLELESYPATAMLYAFGLGTLLANRLSSLGVVFNTVAVRENRVDKRIVELLPVWAMFERGGDSMKILPGREKEFTPLNNRLESHLFKNFSGAYSSKEVFAIAFDKFEIIAALGFASFSVEAGSRYWCPPGCYGWRHNNRQRIVNDLRKDFSDLGEKSALITSNVVGKTVPEGLNNLLAFEEFLTHFHWH